MNNKQINLGIGASDAGDVRLNLEAAIGQRILVQGASGAGKSYLLRKIIEQVCPHVPVLVIDPEGEFHSLREKRDLVVVAANGDIRPDPSTADLLARKLAELKVSAVVDISDLPVPARRMFVAKFASSIMDRPRDQWRPLFVVIDEAHLLVPQHDQDAVSREPINRLASQGRKRSIGCLLATQRLSKVDKDTVAECNHVFVGRTYLDVDIKRASDVLGMTAASRTVLRDLKAGEWFCFGPALDIAGVGRMRCDKTETSHPRPGQHGDLRPPAPSSVIAKHIAELQGADRRADDPLTLDEAKGMIDRLRREAKAAPAPVSKETIQAAVDKAVKAEQASFQGHLQSLRQDLHTIEQRLRSDANVRKASLDKLQQTINTCLDAEKADLVVMSDVAAGIGARMHRMAHKEVPGWTPNGVPAAAPAAPVPGPVLLLRAPNLRQDLDRGEVRLGKAHRAVLTVLAVHGECDKAKLAILAGYSAKGGGFNNCLSDSRTNGWITGSDMIGITPEGIAAVGPIEPLPTGTRLAQYWLDNGLDKAERAILATLVSRRQPVEKADLAAATQYSPLGGGFNNALSRLRTRGLISGSKTLAASPHLFD